MLLSMTLLTFKKTGKSILGSMEGGVFPEEVSLYETELPPPLKMKATSLAHMLSQYIPNMIRWYHTGRFPVDKLVKFYPAKDFQKAARDMEEGIAIKPVLIW